MGRRGKGGGGARKQDNIRTYDIYSLRHTNSLRQPAGDTGESSGFILTPEGRWG